MVTISRSIIASLLEKLPFVTGGVSSKEINSDIERDMAVIEELERRDNKVKAIRSDIHLELVKYYALTSPIFLIAITVLIAVVICTLGLMGIQHATSVAFGKFLAKDIERGISTEPLEVLPA